MATVKVSREYSVTVNDDDVNVLQHMPKGTNILQQLYEACTRYADVGDEGGQGLYLVTRIEGDERVYEWLQWNDIDETLDEKLYGPINDWSAEEIDVEIVNNRDCCGPNRGAQMRKYRLTKEYEITLPDYETPEWDALVARFLASDPEYADVPENMEPQVLTGSLVFWLHNEDTLIDHNIEDWTGKTFCGHKEYADGKCAEMSCGNHYVIGSDI